MRFFYSFAIILFSQVLLSQELNQDFINSLPSNIKEDVIASISQDDLGSPKSNKNYTSFDSKVAQDINQSSSSDLKRFGDIFFVNTPSTFMPINDPATNSGYILDVDDEVLIQIIGDRSDQYSFRIDRTGSIAINDVGNVVVAGLSLESANNLINEILRKNFIETKAVISLKGVRDIEVLITGHVKSPGVYVLSGYSNILHALIMSGGISEHGSLRNITLKRASEKERLIDLYDIMVLADMSSNISLRSGDAIFVNSTQNLVPVIGGVAREAIYEFKDNETSEDLISFAGGRTMEANLGKTILSRLQNGKLNSFELNGSTKLLSNDKIFISYNEFDPNSFVIDSEKNFISTPVIVSGAVKNPGEYFIEEGESLLSLLQKVGGYRKNAYPFGGVLINEDAAMLETSYNAKLYNEAIKSLASISNASRDVDITALTAILSEFKEVKSSGRVVTEFNINNLENDITLDTVLTPGDSIFIPFKTERVHIFGEVLNPGTLKHEESYSMKDYIEDAGGFNKYSDKRAVIIISANGLVQRAMIRNFGSSRVEIKPGTVIYVPRDLSYVEGTELARIIAPIFSSLAISLASLNSISNN